MSQSIPDFPPEYDFLWHFCSAVNRQDYRSALENLKKGFQRNLETSDRIDGVELTKHMQVVVRALETNLRAAYGYDWEHNLDVPKIAESQRRLRCSFCGKRQGEVTKIISGGPASICNECVGICNEILKGEASGSSDGIA
jgi:hypothetical protein